MPNARVITLQLSVSVLLVVAAMWAATQWAAASLGFQPALGAPWIALAGLPIYAPWKLFPWWLAFDAQAPGVFNRAGALAAFGGVAAGLVAIGGAAWRGRAGSTVTTYGSARWADWKDIEAAGLVAGRGVMLGLYDDVYLRHDGPEHLALM